MKSLEKHLVIIIMSSLAKQLHAALTGELCEQAPVGSSPLLSLFLTLQHNGLWEIPLGKSCAGVQNHKKSVHKGLQKGCERSPSCTLAYYSGTRQLNLHRAVRHVHQSLWFRGGRWDQTGALASFFWLLSPSCCRNHEGMMSANVCRGQRSFHLKGRDCVWCRCLQTVFNLNRSIITPLSI